MKTTYEYYRPDRSNEFEGQTFQSDHDGSDEWDYNWTAEKICEAHFSNWDYSCPEVLMLRKQGDSEWKRFCVEVEQVPQFSAWRKRD